MIEQKIADGVTDGRVAAFKAETALANVDLDDSSRAALIVTTDVRVDAMAKITRPTALDLDISDSMEPAIARLESHAVELTEANAQTLLAGSAVVVDAFDSISARCAAMAATAALDALCLHIALAGDGVYGCGSWDAAYHLPLEASGMDGCGYGLSRTLAMLCANASAEVLVRYLHNSGRQGFEITLRDLTMQRM